MTVVDLARTLLEVPCPACREAAPSFTVTFVGKRGEKGVMVSCNDCGRTQEASASERPKGAK